MTKEKSPQFNSALQYHSYALKYDVYKASIDRLIELASPYFSHPITIYDLACGTGISTKRLANTFPSAHIIGIDKSSEMLEVARKELGGKSHISFEQNTIEDIDLTGRPLADVIFCNAAFWYFDTNKSLAKIYGLLSPGSVFAFNISEPAINFEDGKYDDRFLQTMVEVLDSRGIIFHREGGSAAGKLKLSYEPPTVSHIEKVAAEQGLKLLKKDTWKFTKTLSELAEFYMMPGFGTKAFRELTDESLKQDIIQEITRRLEADGVRAINFRWAEFCFQK